MLRSLFHKTLSCLLALLLLTGTTAKEFIHSFASHDDTVHHPHQDGVLSFESKHHHCEFLSFMLASFTADANFEFNLTEKIFTASYRCPEVCAAANTEDAVCALRGPPSVL